MGRGMLLEGYERGSTFVLNRCPPIRAYQLVISVCISRWSRERVDD